MKLNLSGLSLLVLMPIIFISCGGDKADLEKAGYLSAKGDIASANEAYQLVRGLINSDDADVKLKAVRIYAGAQMTRAGFSSTRLISYLLYRESDETLAILRRAVTLADDSDTLLLDAIDKLTTVIASSAYTNASTIDQQDTQFSLGLANLFTAARDALVSGGIETEVSTYDLATCRASVNANIDAANRLNSELQDSRTAFVNSGLETGNSIITLVDTFEEGVPDSSSLDSTQIDNLCNYLIDQNQQTGN